MGRNLFVSRLSFYTTQDQLKKLFAPFGLVTSVNLVVDPRTKRPKGFAFVSYESQIEAEKAMRAMNGRIVDGRLIFVEPANEK
ncbi:hypothetical protein PHAVU_L003243 [Phaseolus vulgaris]|uniref:RRM domain-containing protein n=2 Tax=Phaseolus vulgaris TaxID=3885 RepID=V7BYY1_PHAVU|nr:hypothetical protein PHAVU_005G141700g [Phaseolus vulgaris]ESW22293.1 hypothetical protein PHAVU_005G141700g [Phaseolus vulgaris]